MQCLKVAEKGVDKCREEAKEKKGYKLSFALPASLPEGPEVF